jgi:hypothetical protein
MPPLPTLPTPMPALAPPAAPPPPICAYAAPVIPNTMDATSIDRATFVKRKVFFMSCLTLIQRMCCREIIRNAVNYSVR